MAIRDSKHGKDILENTKQYEAANLIVEKIDYKTYCNRMINLENGNISDYGNIFCRKKTWNVTVLCRNIYLDIDPLS